MPLYKGYGGGLGGSLIVPTELDHQRSRYLQQTVAETDGPKLSMQPRLAPHEREYLRKILKIQTDTPHLWYVPAKGGNARASELYRRKLLVRCWCVPPGTPEEPTTNSVRRYGYHVSAIGRKILAVYLEPPVFRHSGAWPRRYPKDPEPD